MIRSEFTSDSWPDYNPDLIRRRRFGGAVLYTSACGLATTVTFTGNSAVSKGGAIFLQHLSHVNLHGTYLTSPSLRHAHI